MNTQYSKRKIAPLTGLLFSLFLVSIAAAAVESPPFRVVFENACKQQVQAKFSDAITLLHSFEYPETTRLFTEILAEEPDCVMAHWGAAMSIWHPLWAPPGKDDLAAGTKLLGATDGLEKTARESAYIEALKAFFSSVDTSTHMERARAYEKRMSGVYSQHLDDPEAAIFYALALLATQDPHDKSYAHSFKSAGLLNWVREIQPGHPAVMHYLIHSYDFPGLAHLALGVAKTYARAAPDSTHAQHMPSHIFTRLGLWELSLSSNQDSTRSAAQYTHRAHLHGHYDEGLHSMDYLMYAMLQTARDAEAKALLDTLANIAMTDSENFKVAYTYAASPARYVLERRNWQEASELQLMRKDFAWDEFGWAQSIHHFARGIGAIRSGQIEKARAELASIQSLRESLPGTTPPYWKEQVQVQAESLMSWILFAEGKSGDALALAAIAAEREDAVDKHPVTPGEVLPARELYADMLREAGDGAGALVQYEIVLKNSPSRLNALIGAASVAEKGDVARRQKYTAVIRQQTSSGDQGRAGLSAILMSTR